jgi:hypothetical protein
LSRPQIGRFGIGFVSVNQITDTPIIRSAGIEMNLVPLDGTGDTRSIPDNAGIRIRVAVGLDVHRHAKGAERVTDAGRPDNDT